MQKLDWNCRVKSSSIWIFRCQIFIVSDGFCNTGVRKKSIMCVTAIDHAAGIGAMIGAMTGAGAGVGP
jgi:hypothetical protein